MAKMIGNLAMNIGVRPCDLAGFHGTILERLFFDARIIRETTKDTEVEGGSKSTMAKIMERRKTSGVYR